MPAESAGSRAMMAREFRHFGVGPRHQVQDLHRERREGSRRRLVRAKVHQVPVGEVAVARRLLLDEGRLGRKLEAQGREGALVGAYGLNGRSRRGRRGPRCRRPRRRRTG
jgi:hypothetical protein